MLRLQRPDEVDAKGYFDTIVEGRQKSFKERLEAVKGEVHEAYESYWVGDDRLAQRQPHASFSDPQVNALKGCWNAPGRQRLERDIRGWQDGAPASGICPYCGIGLSTDTMEHYLPQTEFPEFVVFALNLVPCCSGCNKPRKWRDASRERKLLHFYFDAIEEQTPYLSAEVYERGKIGHNGKLRWRARFDTTHPEEPNEFFQRYCRHVETLNLRERFNDASELYLSDEIPRLAQTWEVRSADLLKKKLRRQATSRAVDYGANEWRVAALHAAADSSAYLSYCTGRS